MPEIGTGLTVAKAAVDIIKGAKKGGWLDSLLAIFRKKHKVLLLGCSGVGKTLFRDSLKTDVVPKPIPRDERTRKDDSYKITFAGRPFEFFDQSGQLIEGPRRDGVTRQAGGENAGTIGIINVVAYGYHVLTNYKPDIKRGKLVEKEFLEKRRQVEINALNEWTSMLCGREGSAKYVLTLVSKADLWWSQHDEVMAYYEEGKYFQELNEAKDMHHIVLPYCSVIQMFYDEMETSGRFQDSDRKSAKAHLIDTLVGLAGKRQKF